MYKNLKKNFVKLHATWQADGHVRSLFLISAGQGDGDLVRRCASCRLLQRRGAGTYHTSGRGGGSCFPKDAGCCNRRTRLGGYDRNKRQRHVSDFDSNPTPTVLRPLPVSPVLRATRPQQRRIPLLYFPHHYYVPMRLGQFV